MFWEKFKIENKDLLIPASILLGAIIISTSIIWGQGGSTGSSAVALKAQDNQVVQAPAEGGVVKVSERKSAPTIGSGKVEIVEFSDFQCPFCQKFFNDAYKEIKAKYIDTGKARLTFRHYPLPFHQNAQKAAEAFECAYKQQKSFRYHDVLFEKMQADGTGLAVADLKQYARDLGLNGAQFDSCLDGGEMAEAVKKDFEDGQKAGVNGTPTLLINGKKIVGAQPFGSFQSAIEAALR